MNLVKKILDFAIFKPVEILVIIFGVLLAGVVFLQVLLRYLMDVPFAWTEEVSRVLLLIWVMLGAALAYRKDRHMGLDFVEALFRGKAKLIFIIFRRILVIIFSCFLFYQGFLLTQRLRAVTPILGIPLNYVYYIIPISMGMFTIWALIQLIEDIINLFQKNVPTQGGEVQ